MSLDGRGRGRGKQSPERHRARLNTKAPWIEIKDDLFLHDHDHRLHFRVLLILTSEEVQEMAEEEVAVGYCQYKKHID